MVASISLYAINCLNQIRNDSLDHEEPVKGLKKFGVDLAITAAILILAPIEIITRIALSLILALPTAISTFTDDKANITEIFIGATIYGVYITALAIAHGFISICTDLTFYNDAINHQGQYELFLGKGKKNQE